MKKLITALGSAFDRVLSSTDDSGRRVTVRSGRVMDSFTGHTDEGREQVEGLFGVVCTLLVFLIALGGYYSAKFIFYLFTTLHHWIADKWILAEIGAVSAILIGLVLFYFRERRRMAYALLELAFAVVAGGLAIITAKPGEEFQGWVAFGAAAYLTVRGLDNLQKAGFDLTIVCDRALMKLRPSGRGDSAEVVGGRGTRQR